ncbi:type II toxin-antitoxin system Phd/YefM family antitoxin [Spirochaeta dissipatitropha]
MKTVNVRNLQHHLGQYLHEVEAGEVLEVRRRGKLIARIVPEYEAAEASPWPDVAGRLEQVFPDGPVSQSASQLLYDDRGNT